MKYRTVGAVSGTQTNRTHVVGGMISITGGTTPVISASYNVASLVDSGIGWYTITWIRPFRDIDYTVTGMNQGLTTSTSNRANIKTSTPFSTTAVAMTNANGNNVLIDATNATYVAIGNI